MQPQKWFKNYFHYFKKMYIISSYPKYYCNFDLFSLWRIIWSITIRTIQKVQKSKEQDLLWFILEEEIAWFLHFYSKFTPSPPSTSLWPNWHYATYGQPHSDERRSYLCWLFLQLRKSRKFLTHQLQPYCLGPLLDYVTKFLNLF